MGALWISNAFRISSLEKKALHYQLLASKLHEEMQRISQTGKHLSIHDHPMQKQNSMLLDDRELPLCFLDDREFPRDLNYFCL